MNENIREITEIITRLQDCGRKRISQTEGVIVNNKDIATALVKAGYRKQSETVKEFVKKSGKDFAIQLGVWGSEAQRNALDKAWKTINELAEQFGTEER